MTADGSSAAYGLTEPLQQAIAEAEELIANAPFIRTEADRLEGYEYLSGRIRMAMQTAFAAGDMVICAFVEMGEPNPNFEGGDTAKTFDINFLLVNGAKYDPKAVLVA